MQQSEWQFRARVVGLAIPRAQDFKKQPENTSIGYWIIPSSPASDLNQKTSVEGETICQQVLLKVSEYLKFCGDYDL